MPPEPGPSGLTAASLGLFGVMQAAVQQHANVAQIWATLRDQASLQQSALRMEAPPGTFAERQVAGAQVLRSQGIDFFQVNKLRSAAGQWLRAMQRLQAGGEGEQIDSGSVFTPPWATSGVGGVRPSFRLRSHLTIGLPDGGVIERWFPITVGHTLTTRGDLLGTIQDVFAKSLAQHYPPGTRLLNADQLSLEVV